MAAIFSFKCSSCNEVHSGSPSFSFKAPDPYLEQPESIQNEGMLGTDLCYFVDEDGYHYFVRGCLEIPICGVEEPFIWGVWVSLSKVNYERYVETYDEPDIDDCYFGWLRNGIPFYESTYALKTNVRPRDNGIRPYIELQECDHELFVDFYHGISTEKAQEVAEKFIHIDKLK